MIRLAASIHDGAPLAETARAAAFSDAGLRRRRRRRVPRRCGRQVGGAGREEGMDERVRVARIHSCVLVLT
jgi:hypothetical protein